MGESSIQGSLVHRDESAQRSPLGQKRRSAARKAYSVTDWPVAYLSGVPRATAKDWVLSFSFRSRRAVETESGHTPVKKGDSRCTLVTGHSSTG